MKKYLIGALFGVALMLPLSVYAEEVKSIVGSVIQGEFIVKVNGQELTNKAIVVDGTSYLPVREFSEKLGMEVKFSEESGIEVNKKTPNPEGVEALKRSVKLHDLRKEYDNLNQKITELYKQLEPYEITKLDANGKPTIKQKDSFYEETKKSRDELIIQRNEIDKEIQGIVKESQAEADKFMEELKKQYLQ